MMIALMILAATILIAVSSLQCAVRSAKSASAIEALVAIVMAGFIAGYGMRRWFQSIVGAGIVGSRINPQASSLTSRFRCNVSGRR